MGGSLVHVRLGVYGWSFVYVRWESVSGSLVHLRLGSVVWSGGHVRLGICDWGFVQHASDKGTRLIRTHLLATQMRCFGHHFGANFGAIT